MLQHPGVVHTWPTLCLRAKTVLTRVVESVCYQRLPRNKWRGVLIAKGYNSHNVQSEPFSCNLAEERASLKFTAGELNVCPISTSVCMYTSV